MKKKTLFLQLAITASLLFSTAANAAEITSTRDIPVGGSGQMEMVGTIEPTILSVTLKQQSVHTKQSYLSAYQCEK